MKKNLLFVSCLLMVLGGFAQSDNFSKEAKHMEARMQDWTNKKGYRMLVKFDLTTNASFYVEQNQDYAIFYIYDMDPKKQSAFKAYLMTPKDSLREKYTAKPSGEIAASGTAGAQVLQIATKDLGGAKKLPVKLEGTTKSKMYVYRKTKTAA